MEFDFKKPNFEIRADACVGELNNLKSKHAISVHAMNSTSGKVDQGTKSLDEPHTKELEISKLHDTNAIRAWINEGNVQSGEEADIVGATETTVSVLVVGPSSNPDSYYEEAYKEIDAIVIGKYKGVKTDGTEGERLMRSSVKDFYSKKGKRSEFLYYIFS